MCIAKIISAHLHQLLSIIFYFYNPQTYRKYLSTLMLIFMWVRPEKKKPETLNLNYPCMFFWKCKTNLVWEAVEDGSMVYL